ncbi:MAG: class I SAM-dependent methyltransferase [Solirubrobacteraceae bacterium]
MTLLDLPGLVPLLICPRCRAGLVRSPRLACSSPSCAFSAPRGFPEIGRWPALVDFDTSILTLEELSATGGAVAPARAAWSLDRLPDRLRLLWKPRNEVAASNIALLLSLVRQPSPLILVIGGGSVGNGVEALYEAPRVRLIGLDIYCSDSTQLIADAHRLPLADASVDAVVIQAVLEHVLDPARVVTEIHRVLRPDGLVYSETPFLQQVHAGPYDFTRYTSSGHRFIFRRFAEISAGAVAGPGTQLLWSLDHLVRGITRSQLAGKLIRGAAFWLRYLDRLIPPSFALDGASACYFLGRRSEHELEPAEIVGYYRGAQRVAGSRCS